MLKTRLRLVWVLNHHILAPRSIGSKEFCSNVEVDLFPPGETIEEVKDVDEETWKVFWMCRELQSL